MSAAERERRLRVPLEGLASGERALPREAAVYVARVHRAGVGEGLVLFDPEHAIEAEARVVAVGAGGRSVTVRIGAVRPAEVRAARSVTLVQALGKGDKVDAIVRDATELGATRIVPAIAERSVARPEDAAARAARWRRIAVEAARQCGRGDVPAIEAPAPLGEVLAALAARPEGARGFGACLAPGAPETLGAALGGLAAGTAVTIVVGPEGGLSDGEVAACEAAGLGRFGLGEFELRTETVCAAVLGALLVLARPAALSK
jgi:16S rRNA (uracil1498-N3)-methyltransferase